MSVAEQQLRKIFETVRILAGETGAPGKPMAALRRHELKDVSASIAEFRRSVDGLRESLQRLAKEVQDLDLEVLDAKARISNVEQLLQHAETAIEQIEDNLRNIQGSVDSIVSQLENVDRSLSQAASDIKAVDQSLQATKHASFVVTQANDNLPNALVLSGQHGIDISEAEGGKLVVSLPQPADAGSVLTSFGAHENPRFMPAPRGRLLGVQVIAATAIYKPTEGTQAVLAILVGGGGQGGGSQATSMTQVSHGSGGNAGAVASGWLTSAFSGKQVSVGVGGSNGGVGAAGQSGGSTVFAGITAAGGAGGTSGSNQTMAHFTDPNPATAAPDGGNLPGKEGDHGNAGFSVSIGVGRSGRGGTSPYGRPGVGRSSPSDGGAASGYGAGGGGGFSPAMNAARAGGSGSPGVAILYEYA